MMYMIDRKMSWCTMKVPTEVETTPTTNTKTRCTRKNTGQVMATSKRITIMALWAILIFSQMVPAFSAKHQYSSPSSKVLSRKALFFDTVSFHAAATPSPSPLEAVDLDDKRRIHTGPNPLHN